MIVVLRSALFLIWFAVISVTMNVGALPLLALPRRFVVAAGRAWARLMLWGLKRIAGVGLEIRGRKPEPGRPVFIAAKHLSMWETIAFMDLHPDPAIVIKRELLAVPLYGWYCRKMDMIPIDRGAGAKAIRVLHKAAERAFEQGRPVIIFPEGTRKKIGAPPDYKPGVAALYALFKVPCVPAALNSSLFWRGRFLRLPGTIVVEYLEPIPAGLARSDFMRILETRIETAQKPLIAEGRAALAAMSRS
jgi:1-acyl-sn-glycerol-3-phosphate acyltransferase